MLCCSCLQTLRVECQKMKERHTRHVNGLDDKATRTVVRAHACIVQSPHCCRELFRFSHCMPPYQATKHWLTCMRGHGRTWSLAVIVHIVRTMCRGPLWRTVDSLLLSFRCTFVCTIPRRISFSLLLSHLAYTRTHTDPINAKTMQRQSNSKQTLKLN